MTRPLAHACLNGGYQDDQPCHMSLATIPIWSRSEIARMPGTSITIMISGMSYLRDPRAAAKSLVAPAGPAEVVGSRKQW